MIGNVQGFCNAPTIYFDAANENPVSVETQPGAAPCRRACRKWGRVSSPFHEPSNLDCLLFGKRVEVAENDARAQVFVRFHGNNLKLIVLSIERGMRVEMHIEQSKALLV